MNKLTTKKLIELICNDLKIADWLYQASYKMAGNHIDTLALLFVEPATPANLLETIPAEITPYLASLSYSARVSAIRQILGKEKREAIATFKSEVAGEATVVLLSAKAIPSEGSILLKFGIWHLEKLVPIAELIHKFDEVALSEFKKLLSDIPKQRFGDTVSLEPRIVYQITFAGILHAPRTKAKVKLAGAKIMKQVGFDLELVTKLNELDVEA